MNLVGQLIYDSALNGYADPARLFRVINDLIQLEKELAEDQFYQIHRSAEPLDPRSDLKQKIVDLRRKIGLNQG